MTRNHPEYIAPPTLEDALALKRDLGVGARVIAGGTDLILRMRDHLLAPQVLLDLRHLAQDGISVDANGLKLGARVTQEQILQNADIARQFPALVESCRHFAGPPIRNRGTVGGNIVNASPAADLVPPLMAYDAIVELRSLSAVRALPLQDFFTGPGQTVIAPDEILTTISLPPMPEDTVTRFIKLGQRRSMAISIVNVCIRLSMAAEGRIEASRIVLGAVAPTVLRAVAAEAVLTAERLSADLIEQAVQQAVQEISPITDPRASAAYRRQMSRVLVRRALTDSWAELNKGRSHE